MSDLTRDAERSRASKIALRSRLVTSRRTLSPASLASAAAAIHDQVLSLVRRERPSIIAAYVPVGREPGGAELVVSLSTHARVLLPVLLTDGDLDWAFFDASRADGPADQAGPPDPASAPDLPSVPDLARVPGLARAPGLVGGPRGLLEPAGPRLGVAGITSAQLVLVPALAVDRRGLRMGRGGGSYDRALSRLPATGGPPVVALLHDGELVDTVPAEPHDRPVHAAITPRVGLTVFVDPLRPPTQ